MKLFAVIVFGTRVSRSGKPILGYRTAAICEGKLEQAKQRNYRAGPFLKRAVEVLGSHPELFTSIELGSYSCARKEAREISHTHGGTLSGLISEENARRVAQPNSQDLCDLMTGLPVTQKARRKADRVLIERIEQRISSRAWGESRTPEFIRHFNAKASNTFTAMIRQNLPLALQLIDEEPSSRKRELELNGLIAACENPRPIYRPSRTGNTSRIFPATSSLLTVSKELRRRLCAGCYDCDIVNAQLAVVAMRWQIPELQEFLRSGNEIWSEMSDWLGMTISGKTKQALKHQALYPLVYGREPSYAVRELAASGYFSHVQASRFITHPLIQALIRRRDQVIATAKERSWYETFYGQRRLVESSVKPGNKRSTSNVPSILAQDAQEIEMELMYPLLQFDRRDDLNIVLFQHDGMTVKFAKPDRIQSLQQRMSTCFQDHAAALGVSSSLNWEACWTGEEE